MPVALQNSHFFLTKPRIALSCWFFAIPFSVHWDSAILYLFSIWPFRTHHHHGHILSLSCTDLSLHMKQNEYRKKNNKILLCLQFSQIKLDNKSLFVFGLCFLLVYCVYIYVSLSQFHFDHHYYYHSYYIHHFCSSPEFLHIIIYVVVHSIDRGHGPICRVAMWVHAFDTSAYVSCTIPSITPPLIQHLSIQLTQNVKRKNACLVIIHTYI